MQNSFELLCHLKALGYIKEEVDEYWWPNSGTFEVIPGVILVQNTKWKLVERALGNLRSQDLLSFEALAEVDLPLLEELIKEVGLYKTKAARLKRFCQNATKDFADFEDFREGADKEWLLAQKGIGLESCDSILCYACFHEEMVADKYAYKLLSSFGYTLEGYHEIKEWLEQGIREHYKEVMELYGYEISLHKVFARFHGKIVEHGKDRHKQTLKETL